MSDWGDFCLNANGSDNFFQKYVWNSDNSLFNPCFLTVTISTPHLFLLILTKFYFCKRTERTFHRKPEVVVVLCKFVSSLTSFTALLTLILTRHMVAEYKIEKSDYFYVPLNGFLAYVWFIQSLFWAIIFWKKRKCATFWLNLTFCLAFPTLVMKLYQIWTFDGLNLFVIWNLVFMVAQTFYLGAILTEIFYFYYQRRLDSAQLFDSESLLPEETCFLGPGDQKASILSKLSFWWTNNLMKKGYERELNSINDLYNLPLNLKVESCESKYQKSKEKMSKFSLCKTLLRTFGCEYFSLGFLKFIGDTLTFAGPVLLHYLVTFMEERTEPMKNGYFYAAGMCVAAFISSFCTLHFNFYVSKVGLKVRAALITAIYGKLLKVSQANLAQNKFSGGELMNFMSTDTDRIVNFCPSFHSFWSMPIQLGIALYLLYREVGLAYLTGLGFAVLLIPINKWITVKIGRLSQKMMFWKDKRVRAMTELLFGIRVVKLSCWESIFRQKISQLRSKELHYLKGRKYLDAICVYLWASAPVFIAILTFVTYTLMGFTLTAAKVFTSLALVNMLIMPLNAFPWVLMGIIEAWVSVKRVQKFLQLPEIDYQVQYTMVYKPRNLLTFLDSSFSWNLNNNIAALKHLDLKIQKGQLVGLIGTVGSGKSSLLMSIIGEIHKISGQLLISHDSVKNGFGLFTQEVWLSQATAKENIIFGTKYDHEFYRKVVFGCALEADFERMPQGDLTEISEQGVTLSGGQKARLALARAVYQDKEIYLLDDPLSAVDAAVADHIWRHCIRDILRQRGKTVIIGTHHVHFLTEADLVVEFAGDGTISKCGSPNEVLKNLEETNSYKVEFQNGDQSQSNVLNQGEGVLIQEEEKEIGRVQLAVYFTYLKAVGVLLAIFIFLSLFLMQASKNLSDWWLSYWVGHIEENNKTTTFQQQYCTLSTVSHPFSLYTSLQTSSHFHSQQHNVTFYLTIYGSLAGANTLFTLARAFLFAYGGIIAAKTMHDCLLDKILKAKFRFFDVTPVGRIINRFSSDLYAIDETLPFQSNILLAFLVGALGSIIMMCYALPWFSIFVLIVSGVYYYIQNYYRYTTCELKRLTSVSLSPIYSHFTDTVAGLATIRALRKNNSFVIEIRDRLTDNLRAQFSTLACSQWLSVRLQLIGVAMVTTVALIAVVQHNYQTVDPGLVGLAISYGLSLTNVMSGLVQYFTETEKELVSVERVSDYTKNTPIESDHSIITPSTSWPREPSVEFRDVLLRYDSELPLVLDGVSFTVSAGEKVGIIGRTGSGKSSLFQALFRAVEIETGAITVDGMDISHIDIDRLRSSLCIIPQTPLLFDGSVRENLDILGKYNDDDLLKLATKCQLDNLLERLGGLDGQIGQMGNGLSVGQRQLVCLARAMLTGSMIVCMDEATAQVDRTSEKQIQQILADEFPNCTLLTIAHRLDTVADYGRIIVMDNGKLVAEGKPKDVLGVVE